LFVRWFNLCYYKQLSSILYTMSCRSLQSRLPGIQIVPMAFSEWLVCLPACFRPNDLISLVDLCWVHALFPQRHLVLFVVVDWRHVLDDSEEDWHGVFWEAGSGVSVKGSAMRTVGTRISGELTGAMLRNQSYPAQQDQCRWRRTQLE
jgi:hypothetical protein